MSLSVDFLWYAISEYISGKIYDYISKIPPPHH